MISLTLSMVKESLYKMTSVNPRKPVKCGWDDGDYRVDASVRVTLKILISRTQIYCVMKNRKMHPYAIESSAAYEHSGGLAHLGDYFHLRLIHSN